MELGLCLPGYPPGRDHIQGSARGRGHVKHLLEYFMVSAQKANSGLGDHIFREEDEYLYGYHEMAGGGGVHWLLL